MTSRVREQYERFPYPPIPLLALPKRSEGAPIRLERGSELAGAASDSRGHAGARILIAGAGTFETLVVAQQHPQAREVVAVDLSGPSIARTRFRLRLARLSLLRRKLPRVRLVVADLFEWQDSLGAFDYIVASNVLHHVEEPARLLSRLASWLAPGGLMRVVTYPKESRHWIRETGRFFRSRGISPETRGLPRAAREAIGTLPTNHPVREFYESHPEVGTATGIVDAFLHSLENPLSPLEWRRAVTDAGLELVAEDHDELSRSHYLERLLPDTAALDDWEKLQVLDDCRELAVNPILWLQRASGSSSSSISRDARKREIVDSRELLLRCGSSWDKLESALARVREAGIGQSVSGVTATA